MLATGTKLGPYEIVGSLGAGGMGEVYRAQDSKLGRQVALKILPDEYAHDPDRLARFRREAQALAALNHPHIAQIYGLEDTAEPHALVLELVEGPTLATEIAAAGASGLGVRQALEIARQIIDALEAAHAQGIVHRDLKPANIKLQTDPTDQTVTVKVLDFGLAKAVSGDTGSGSDIATSPTITSPATLRGVILGTAGYMAPEQAMGKVADKRADIWAFGVVLYEMLAGHRPFAGADAGALMTESLTSDADLRALPADTPAGVRRLIQRCLEKNPRRRLRDIGDARIELDEPEVAGTPARPESGRGARLGAWIAWALVAALSAALALVLLGRDDVAPAAEPSLQFTLVDAEGDPAMLEFAIAPDGRSAAFVVRTRAGSSLWIRAFDTLAPTELADTAKARDPFWSPDSTSLGFFVDGRIRTINLATGVTAAACEAPVTGGAAWGPGGLILHGGSTGIRACGRDTPLTVLEPGHIEHRSPWILPDGRHFVYQALTDTSAELRVGSLEAGGRTAVVGPAESHAVYSDGHLLYLRAGVLLAQPFDTVTLTITAEPFRVTEAVVMTDADSGRASVSASAAGTIGIGIRDPRPATLTWFNRAGVALGTVGAPTILFNLGLSPDERRLAISRRVRAAHPTDIWIVDLARSGQFIRVTDHEALEFDPFWSRDGRTLIFNSNRRGPFDLYRRPADASGEDELIASHAGGVTTPVWSPAEDVIFYSVGVAGANADIWMLPVVAGGKPTPFLATAFSESQPAVSPDGQWIAYTSNVSGRDEVYVRPRTGDAAAVPVSLHGGSHAAWRGDGREIFFVDADLSMMAAAVDRSNGIRVADPVKLFDTELQRGDGHPYVVTNDGQRFLFGVRHGPPVGMGVTIVTNWLQAPRR